MNEEVVRLTSWLVRAKLASADTKRGGSAYLRSGTDGKTFRSESNLGSLIPSRRRSQSRGSVERNTVRELEREDEGAIEEVKSSEIMARERVWALFMHNERMRPLRSCAPVWKY